MWVVIFLDGRRVIDVIGEFPSESEARAWLAAWGEDDGTDDSNAVVKRVSMPDA